MPAASSIHKQAMVQAECPDFTNPTHACNTWLDTMSTEAGSYYAYNLYDDCGSDQQTTAEAGDAASEVAAGRSKHGHLTWRGHRQVSEAGMSRAGAGAAPSVHNYGYPCGKQQAATAWLNTNAVRKALHVPSSAWYGYPFTMEAGARLKYTRDVASLVDTYLRIIPKTRVLVHVAVSSLSLSLSLSFVCVFACLSFSSRGRI
jgi:hypothetical protein